MAKPKTETQTPAVQAALAEYQSALAASRKAAAAADGITTRRQETDAQLLRLRSDADAARKSAKNVRDLASMDAALQRARECEEVIRSLEAEVQPLIGLQQRSQRDASHAESLVLDAQRRLFCLAYDEERRALLAELPLGFAERMLSLAGTWWRTGPGLGHQAPWPAFLAGVFQDPGHGAMEGSHDSAPARLGLEV